MESLVESLEKFAYGNPIYQRVGQLGPIRPGKADRAAEFASRAAAALSTGESRKQDHRYAWNNLLSGSALLAGLLVGTQLVPSRLTILRGLMVATMFGTAAVNIAPAAALLIVNSKPVQDYLVQ